MNTVRNLPDGTFSLDEVVTRMRDGSDIHNTKTSLICVENTHNWCGGVALPLTWMSEVGLFSTVFCKLILSEDTN